MATIFKGKTGNELKATVQKLWSQYQIDNKTEAKAFIKESVDNMIIGNQESAMELFIGGISRRIGISYEVVKEGMK